MLNHCHFVAKADKAGWAENC